MVAAGLRSFISCVTDALTVPCADHGWSLLVRLARVVGFEKSPLFLCVAGGRCGKPCQHQRPDPEGECALHPRKKHHCAHAPGPQPRPWAGRLRISLQGGQVHSQQYQELSLHAETVAQAAWQHMVYQFVPYMVLHSVDTVWR